VKDAVAEAGSEAHLCTHWSDGSAGAMALGRAVASRLRSGPASFTSLYPEAMQLEDKIRAIATRIYRAADVAIAPGVAKRLAAFEAAGFGHLPVCIAKTQYSFSANPQLLGAPDGHVLPVREARLAAGAGFVVALAGDVMTMPGLPRVPAAETITLNADGAIEGLF
jgi:formate--tetrahydrofolate ligase